LGLVLAGTALSGEPPVAFDGEAALIGDELAFIGPLD